MVCNPVYYVLVLFLLLPYNSLIINGKYLKTNEDNIEEDRLTSATIIDEEEPPNSKQTTIQSKTIPTTNSISAFSTPLPSSTRKIINITSVNTLETTTATATAIITTTTRKAIKDIKIDCPDLENGDTYTQATFLERLTAPCRYDRLTRPGGDVHGQIFHSLIPTPSPDKIYVQLDIRHIEAAEHLQFKMHMLLQYRYKDRRLDYRRTSPGRARIVGEDLLRARVWVPHVLLENERDSAIMGHDSKDIYLAIEPNGEVTYSRRIKATLYCWMDLQKFPFDEQECDIRFLSWTYNASELILEWEEDEPVVIANQLHLTEYSLKGFWTENEIRQGSKQSKGAFTGNYSSLTFRFHMAREMGYYMLDYFIPSIMLVCISWVSFWLQADASAPRITIGTSTMLSFITLATAQTRTLPKVSYIKASEIWFLGCTIFIFGSMVEFAFVNIIWRRKSNVELKKKNSKYILKSTFTPRLHRKGLQKSHSCSSLDHNSSNSIPQYNNYLTVHSFSAGMSLPRITTESVDDLIASDKCNSNVTINVAQDNDDCEEMNKNNANNNNNNRNNNHQQHTWTTMTPQEISQWIDKRSRLVFPCAFIVFNAFYWGFVYWL